MTETTNTQAPAAQQTSAQAAQQPAPAQAARQRREVKVKLSMKDVLAAINDGDGDADTVDELNRALYRFGAQDPSFELPRSWQRVQRRIGLDPEKTKRDLLDGVATADEVSRFADKAGLTITK